MSVTRRQFIQIGGLRWASVGGLALRWILVAAGHA